MTDLSGLSPLFNGINPDAQRGTPFCNRIPGYIPMRNGVPSNAIGLITCFIRIIILEISCASDFPDCEYS